MEALTPETYRQPASAGAISSVSGAFGASHSLPHFMHFLKSPRALDVFISAPTKLHSGHFSFTGGFHATKSQVSLLHAKKLVPRFRERRCTNSPPSFGQKTPVGM